jgi:four helix bundle protein
MDSKELRERSKQFALRIVRLAASLPAGRVGDVLGRQVLKSGTSIGANYREALRASSKRHFVSTVEIALREADETVYWLELLADSGTVKPTRLRALTEEANQLVAILAATVRTAKKRP